MVHGAAEGEGGGVDSEVQACTGQHQCSVPYLTRRNNLIKRKQPLRGPMDLNMQSIL